MRIFQTIHNDKTFTLRYKRLYVHGVRGIIHENLEELVDELAKKGEVLQRGGAEPVLLSYNGQGPQYEFLASFHFDPVREVRILRRENRTASILTIGFERNYSTELHDEMIEKLNFLKSEPSNTFIADIWCYMESEIEMYEECRADSKSAGLDFGKVLSSSRYASFLQHFKQMPTEKVFKIVRETFHVEYP